MKMKQKIMKKKQKIEIEDKEEVNIEEYQKMEINGKF